MKHSIETQSVPLSPLPEGTTIMYPHTDRDEMFNQLISSGITLDDENIIGLVRHAPTARNYGDDIRPRITIPRDEIADSLAEQRSAESKAWDSFPDIK